MNLHGETQEKDELPDVGAEVVVGGVGLRVPAAPRVAGPLDHGGDRRGDRPEGACAVYPARGSGARP